MRILIDADGCPVVEETLEAAREYGAACLILCDTSHVFERPGAETVVVSKGADSVDFALVNRLQKGDVVVTQDYGVAPMCLARGARVLHQDGMEYTADNIDALLMARHTARKVRSSGGRLKGPARRKPEQNTAFAAALRRILSEKPVYPDGERV